ncbi:unnamed protein product [Anisakis simplex]|uniref:Calcyclin-binding protein n=1 Tax=Anisakis simplex TaxID=6269 RepID=A0A0M3IYA3_ANISI|nr:unnamed protein product [Anisakis simplex]
MADSVELRKDIHELKSLRSMCSRKDVRRWLDEKIAVCEHELNELKEQQTKEDTIKPMNSGGDTASPSDVHSLLLPTVKITNYGWDQSDKYVKIYITMTNIQSVSAEQIAVNFNANSFEMHVKNVDGKNYFLTMKDLLCAIKPESSYFKQKTDLLLIMLKKVKEAEEWKYLTKAERASKEKRQPKFDEKADPQESLMTMMKQLYDEGDDDMKRTIRKAWHESQNKMNVTPSDLNDM